MILSCFSVSRVKPLKIWEGRKHTLESWRSGFPPGNLVGTDGVKQGPGSPAASSNAIVIPSN